MTTILTERQYTFNDFYDIERTMTNNICTATIEKINYLAQKVGAPTYKKTPDFNRRNRRTKDPGYKRKIPRTAPTTTEDWEAVRNFHTTKFAKKAEGIAADIDKIRSQLNKLTKKTYDDVLANIQGVLQIIVKDEETAQDNLLKVGNAIFEIGSKNKFWSELYAVLYSDLVKVIPSMSDICKRNFAHFENLFTEIEYVSPDEDYDQYCIINAKNEARKGMSNFLTYLMKNNLIETESMCQLILNLLNVITDNLNDENKSKQIEEVCENLSLLILNGSSKLENSGHWSVIHETVEKFSKLKARDYKGLSQKMVFKMLDICEEL